MAGERGGREGGSDDVRQGGSGKGGREVNKGTSEEGTERGKERREEASG